MDRMETLLKTILDRTSRGQVQWRETSSIPLVLSGTDGSLVYELRKAPMVGGRPSSERVPAISLMVRATDTGESVEVDDTHMSVAALLLSLLTAASDAAAGSDQEEETIGRLLSKIEQ